MGGGRTITDSTTVEEGIEAGDDKNVACTLDTV